MPCKGRGFSSEASVAEKWGLEIFWGKCLKIATEDFLIFCMELSSPGMLITQQMLIHSRESIFPREDNYTGYQASKYLKKGTCPASQKLLTYMGKKYFSLKISKFSLALQPEALVNTSGRVIFSSPGYIGATINRNHHGGHDE